MITINRISVEPTPVYDLTVDTTECFFANNILVHNCAEITLPTRSFVSIDDEGEYELELDNGQVAVLPGQHLVLLKDGTTKKVRLLDDNDDIESLLI